MRVVLVVLLVLAVVEKCKPAGTDLMVIDNKWKNRDPVGIEDIIFGTTIAKSDQCNHDLDLIWKANVGSTITATPIIGDIENDSHKEIIIACDDHYIEALQGDRGHKQDGYPFVFAQSSFRSSPLLYDITNDGKLDIVVATQDGEIVFIRESGYPIFGKTLKVPPLRVKKDWFTGLDDNEVAVNFAMHGMSYEQLWGSTEVASKRTTGRKLLQVFGHDEEDLPEGIDSTVWQGVEGWLPQEGVASLDLFLPTDTPATYVMQISNNLDPLVSRFYEDNKDTFEQTSSDSILVDAHILSTPVIIDLDGDGEDELVVSVSYYMDTTKYADPTERKRFAPDVDLSKYVAGGIVVFSLTDQSIKFSVPLDLTMDKNLYRGHIYAPPAIVDLEGDGELEIIVGTAVGNLYVIKHNGELTKKGWPQMMDAIYGEVVAEDIDNDGKLEIIATDLNHNVVVFNRFGEELWEARFSGIVNSAVSVGDIDGDGKLDIAFVTSTGHMYAYSGPDGKPLQNFPIELSTERSHGHVFVSEVTLVNFYEEGPPNLVVGGLDGHVYIVDGLSGCIDVLDIGEPISSKILVEDVTGNGKLDFIIASTQGEVFCVGTDADYHPLKAVQSGRDHVLKYKRHGLFIHDEFTREISGKEFLINYEIVDTRGHSAYYDVEVNLNGDIIAKQSHESPGLFTEHLVCPSRVLEGGRVSISAKNEFGQVFRDQLSINCNTQFYHVLKWLLVVPFVMMSIVLIYVKELKLSSALPIFASKRVDL